MAVIHASSASHTDVQTAITSASAGDTVHIPAGNVTWTSQVTCAKNIYIEGNGEDSTIITMSSSIGSYVGGLQISATGYYEVKNIKFIATGTYVYSIMTTGLTTSFRVHHCTFEGYKNRFGFSYGLIDHCTFTNCGEAIDIRWAHSLDSTYEEEDPLDGAGSYSWWLGADLGSINKVFIEDCTFSETTGSGHPITAVNGGRYVFRYNTVTIGSSGYSDLDIHGNYYNDRGGFSIEVYENTFSNARASHAYGMYIRGGSGVIFNNELDITGSGTYNIPIALANYRSFNEPYATYPCPDQINNLYIWNNNYDSSPVDAEVVGRVNEDSDIVEDRDFFNTSKSGYVPFTYPHPLQRSNMFLTIIS